MEKILFLDIETTGLESSVHRIVEISLVLYSMEGEVIDKFTTLVNPGMTIPDAVIEIHGITNEIVADAPHFSDIANLVYKMIVEAKIIGGYNSNRFDVPFIHEEMSRAGINWDWKKHQFIDAFKIFVEKSPRNLEAAVQYYLDRDHTGAHKAEDDVMATAEVFFAQLKKHELTHDEVEAIAGMGNVVDIAGKFVKDSDGEVIFNFSKDIGKKAAQQKGMLSWMLKRQGFHPDTIRVAKLLLGGYLK